MAFSDSFLRGIQSRLALEQLAEVESQKETKAKITKAGADAVMGDPTSMQTEDGMTLNTGQSAVKTFRPEEYIKNLRNTGTAEGIELADKFEETHLKHQQEKEFMELTDVHQAIELASAGDTQRALALANKYQSPQEKISGIDVKVDAKTGKKSAVLKMANGKSTNIDDVDGFRNSIVDAKSKWEKDVAFDQTVSLNQFDKPVYDPANKIITQKNKLTGKVDLIANFQGKSGEGKNGADLSPYEKKQQELAAAKYIDSLEDDKKLGQRMDHISQASTSFADYSKNTLFGTGAVAGIWGGTAVDAKLQDVDRKFKALNVQEMVSTFQGMSRAVDSDAERAMFEKKQPSIGNDDTVNAQILVGAQAMTLKQKAENAAVREYIAQNQTLDKYESPVIGKKTVMFDSMGTPVLVDKESADSLKKSGFRSSDDQAHFLIHGTTPKDTSEGLVVDEFRFPTKKALDKYLKDKAGKK